MLRRSSLKRKTKSKAPTQAKLKKLLDKVFSEYVRRSSADENGIAECYTCRQRKHWKELHAGHYVSRSYLATRWDLDNVKTQCPGCNLFGNGKPLDFEERLKKELGDNAVEEMKKKRHTIFKVGIRWYEEQIELYQNELKNYERKTTGTL